MSTVAARTYAALRALRAVAEQPGVFFLSALLAAIAIAVPLFIASAVRSLPPQGERLIQPPEASLFVTPGTGNAELKTLREQARSQAGVASAMLIARDAALAELDARRGQTGLTGLSELKLNPLPDVLVIQFASDIAPDELETTVAALRKLPRVDAVTIDITWYRKLKSLLRFGSTAGLLFGATMGLLLVLILFGAIRLQTAASVAEIRVLQLVGADNRFIVRPYVYLGATTLLLATALAAASVSGAFWLLNPPLAEVAKLYGTQMRLATPEPAVLFGLALLMGTVGAIVAAAAGRSIVRSIARKL